MGIFIFYNEAANFVAPFSIKLLMKVILGICLFVGFSLSGFSQLTAREVSIGGVLGFGSTRNKSEDPFGSKSTYKSYNIGPSAAIGIGGNWMLGMGARYAHGKQTSQSQNNSQSITSYVFEFSALARKYHPFNKQFGIYAQAGPSAGFGKQTGVSNQSNYYKTDLDFYSVSASPGLYFKPNKKFIVEAIFGELIFTHTITTPENGFKAYSDSFDFTLTEAISLGIRYIL